MYSGVVLHLYANPYQLYIFILVFMCARPSHLVLSFYLQRDDLLFAFDI